MNNTKIILLLAGLLSANASLYAASHAGAPTTKEEAKKDVPATAAVDMADGEIRKVDLDAKKITIKHGEIKHLDMPGMTMVFQVKDPALLDKLKAGDKVRFKAEKAGSAIVVTAIQPVR